MNTVLDQAKANTFGADQPKGKTPAVSKVLASNAISRTKSDIAEVQKIGNARTRIVLKAFDAALEQSDSDISEGLKTRLEGERTRFFGLDIEQELDRLLAPAS
jgi:hypothetical protein